MPLIPVAAYRRGLTRSDPSPYYTPEGARQSTMQNFLNQSDVIDQYNQNNVNPDPKYDWASKALKTGVDASNLIGESAQNAIANQLAIQQKQLENMPIGGGQTATGGQTRLGALLRALGSQESGNNYGSINKGSGALGAWQVMPSNVPAWSKQALGHSVSTQQFLSNPQIQKQVVKKIFGGYFKKYGAKGALAAWYSGNPNRYNDKSSVHGGPSVYDYVNSVLSKLGQ